VRIVAGQLETAGDPRTRFLQKPLAIARLLGAVEGLLSPQVGADGDDGPLVID
jgi:hypothetical protein